MVYGFFLCRQAATDASQLAFFQPFPLWLFQFTFANWTTKIEREGKKASPPEREEEEEEALSACSPEFEFFRRVFRAKWKFTQKSQDEA